MQIINIQNIIRLVVLLGAVAGLGLAFNTSVRAGDNKAPELPPACSELQAPEGNKVSFRVYAIGVQVYKWNGASWDFVAPVANLYADEDFHGQVGTHYAGPTWESNSGSKVVAKRLKDCQPDTTAIPWLLLQTVSSEGPGIFRKVTYIQRVNTSGGLRPATPGSFIGEEVRVPYTTEYFFYRGQ